LARISPSRHLVHRRLRVPDQRAEPFFPLHPRRPCWTISPGVAAGLSPARVAASAPSDIIRTRLPRSTSRSRAKCCGNYLIARSADHRQDNRRRLTRCALHTVEEHGIRYARAHPTLPRLKASSGAGSARHPHRQTAMVRPWFLPHTGSRTPATHRAGCSPTHEDTIAFAYRRTALRSADAEPPRRHNAVNLLRRLSNRGCRDTHLSLKI